MNTREIDPERAAAIDKRLKQAFAFARDVLVTPEFLEEIPDGATLFFRDVVYQGQELRLTAHPPLIHSGWWTARDTGPRAISLNSRHWAPADAGGLEAKGGKWGSPPTFPETAPTAEHALDTLQEKLADSDQAAQLDRRGVAVKRS